MICVQYYWQQNIIIKMNRHISRGQLSQQLDKSPSRRGIYINEETNKRETATIFHSPYKDGRPNKQYINPSFVSSHILYSQQQMNNNNTFVCKNNIPTPGEIRKQELYHKRLRTQSNLAERQKTKQMERQKKEINQRRDFPIHARILRLNDPEKLLKNQLSNLQNYRENVENKSIKKQKETFKKDNQIPPYFQKHYRNYPEPQQGTNRSYQLSHRITNIEDIPKNKEEDFQFEKSLNKKFRRQSSLLGSVLREQITLNRQKRQKKWIF